MPKTRWTLFALYLPLFYLNQYFLLYLFITIIIIIINFSLHNLNGMIIIINLIIKD